MVTGAQAAPLDHVTPRVPPLPGACCAGAWAAASPPSAASSTSQKLQHPRILHQISAPTAFTVRITKSSTVSRRKSKKTWPFCAVITLLVHTHRLKEANRLLFLTPGDDPSYKTQLNCQFSQIPVTAFITVVILYRWQLHTFILTCLNRTCFKNLFIFLQANFWASNDLNLTNPSSTFSYLPLALVSSCYHISNLHDKQTVPTFSRPLLVTVTASFSFTQSSWSIC